MIRNYMLNLEMLLNGRSCKGVKPMITNDLNLDVKYNLMYQTMYKFQVKKDEYRIEFIMIEPVERSRTIHVKCGYNEIFGKEYNKDLYDLIQDEFILYNKKFIFLTEDLEEEVFGSPIQCINVYCENGMKIENGEELLKSFGESFSCDSCMAVPVNIALDIVDIKYLVEVNVDDNIEIK